VREYVEGRGLYPERVHLIGLVTRFVDEYLASLERLADWAAGQIETWPDTTTPEPGPEVVAALMDFAALRPVL
jgi:hypothetical protein